jgi:hypothetical protein
MPHRIIIRAINSLNGHAVYLVRYSQGGSGTLLVPNDDETISHFDIPKTVRVFLFNFRIHGIGTRFSTVGYIVIENIPVEYFAKIGGDIRAERNARQLVAGKRLIPNGGNTPSESGSSA